MNTITLDEKDDIGSILLQIEKNIDSTKWFPKNPRKCQVIFRGEPCVYKTALLPKLFRPEIYNVYQENIIFEEFQRQHPEYYQQCDTEFDWLNIMQHNNVPTRFLDWTYSLPIALYFATEILKKTNEENIIDDDCSVYISVPYR